MNILTPEGLYDKLLALKKEIKGSKRGTSTGFPELDTLILLNKKYLLLVTGNGGMGKSEVIDAIALNTAMESGWKWAFFSPENFPVEEHLKKYVERLLKKPFFKITPQEIEYAVHILDKKFFWLDPPDEQQDPKSLLNMIREIKKEKGLDAYVLDPWNELNHFEQQEMRDDQYLSYILTELRKFNRRQDLLGTIVIHPKAMQRDREGNYPVPTLSDCHGGIMWRNKADIGLCVHRHNMQEHIATVYVQKVKFKFMGNIGLLDLHYDVESGRFKDNKDKDFTACWEIIPPF